MRGKTGVVSVVKLLRSRPFGEWNVVYYQPARITLAQITTALRTGGCKNALQIVAKADEGSGARCRIANPIVAGGDLVQLEIVLPAGAKGIAKVALPAGWKMASPIGLKPGVNRVDVKAPTTARRGKHTLKTTLTVAGKSATLSPVVEVVGRVR